MATENGNFGQRTEEIFGRSAFLRNYLKDNSFNKTPAGLEDDLSRSRQELINDLNIRTGGRFMSDTIVPAFHLVFALGIFDAKTVEKLSEGVEENFVRDIVLLGYDVGTPDVTLFFSQVTRKASNSTFINPEVRSGALGETFCSLIRGLLIIGTYLRRAYSPIQKIEAEINTETGVIPKSHDPIGEFIAKLDLTGI